jgi:thiamine-monophosphate kinase
MRIDQLGEFGLIDRIKRALPAPSREVVVGIGDDVAVLRSSSDRVWLATCDVQVEGVHFLRDGIDPSDLGHKALAINLSDIAATAGTPHFALVSLGLPKGLEVEFVDGLYEGLRAEAKKFGVEIVGGNISSSRLGVFIDITLLGDAAPKDIMLRSGAHPGDQILVTGTLGDAAAGVAMLLDTHLPTNPEYATLARSRRNRPTPRIREGQLIGASHSATAMIDVSDGVAGDLGHICEHSKTGVRLYADRLPVDKANRALSQLAHGDEWYFALHGGEDYELLFTAPASRANALASQILRQTGTPVTNIGELLPDFQGQGLVLPDGRVVQLEPRGWDHFNAQASS